MFVSPHITPLKKADSNKGSCRRIAEYLSKDNEVFFNQNSTEILTEDAIKIIDEHSKGRLGINESKWYSPMYSFSEEECQHVVNLLFGDKIRSFDELSNTQIKIYNDFFIQIARAFQDDMAKNFNKEELGIKNGDDLVYVGVIENKRKYTGNDGEIRSKDVIQDERVSKKGFNTHIHIIQSRKANNPKQSKISPNTKYKERNSDNFNNNSRGGFDRTKFYSLVEKTFDKITKYNRNYSETFEYKNEAKKDKKNKEMANNNFISKEEIDRIVENSSIVNYFNSLADRGILKFEKTRGDDFWYGLPNQDSGSISVSDKKGWKDFSNGDGGKIIKAIMKYENLAWKDSINYLKEKNGFNNYNFINEDIKNKIINTKKEEKSDVLVLKTEKPTSKYIFDYYNSRGISDDVIKNNVLQITYKRGDKTYNTGGIENIKGSYNVRGKDFKSVIGENNDISIKEGRVNKKELVIVEGLMDYLSYLELNNNIVPEENVIILNSTSNIESTLSYIDSNDIEKIKILVNNDKAGEKVASIIKEKYLNKIVIEDLREQYQLTDTLDLNDKLVLEKIKDVTKKGYRI